MMGAHPAAAERPDQCAAVERKMFRSEDNGLLDEAFGNKGEIVR